MRNTKTNLKKQIKTTKNKDMFQRQTEKQKETKRNKKKQRQLIGNKKKNETKAIKNKRKQIIHTAICQTSRSRSCKPAGWSIEIDDESRRVLTYRLERKNPSLKRTIFQIVDAVEYRAFSQLGTD